MHDALSIIPVCVFIVWCHHRDQIRRDSNISQAFNLAYGNNKPYFTIKLNERFSKWIRDSFKGLQIRQLYFVIKICFASNAPLKGYLNFNLEGWCIHLIWFIDGEVFMFLQHLDVNSIKGIHWVIDLHASTLHSFLFKSCFGKGI